MLAAAKRRARERDLTLGQFIEEALRRELARDTASAAPVPVPLFRGGGGLRPGVDASSTRALLEALDRDASVESLR